MNQEDTISAVATAPGEGGVGIIRVSGCESLKIADAIFQAKRSIRVKEIPSHRVTYGKIVDPRNQQVVDEVIMLVMKAPHSYTKEDVVEFQCHGSSVALKNILSLTLYEGARLAEPGEFTKRAFLNGRLDLSQAQAVMDIIRSKTDASLRMAVGHLEGKFSDKIRMYRHDILGMIAHLEAAIDFPEEDIDELATDAAREQIISIKEEIDQLLRTAGTGRFLREGLKTIIIGKPNVGKSSLLNALLKENRAIVTDVPGTTRDVIEEYANIGGVPLRIMDTAGIRDTDDLVEKIGVEKARELVASADLILALFDMSCPLEKEDKEILALIQQKGALILLNKNDLQACFSPEDLNKELPDATFLSISTLNGNGMKQLEDEIVNRVYGGLAQNESSFVSSVQQAQVLRGALQRLEEAVHTIDQEMSPDFIVIDLRAAWEKLGELTGDTVGEDIIDQIFSQFCIGK